MPNPFFIAGCLLILGAVYATAPRGLSRSRRICVALVPASVAVALWIVVAAVPQAIHSNWDALRLSFAFAVAKGHSLYQPEIPAGPVLPSIYPPGIAWAYLPVTGFETPTSAIVAARLWTMAMVFGAAFALILKAGRKLTDAVLLACVALFLCQVFLPLKDATRQIHADAPALAFATLALVFLPTQPAKRPGLLAVSGLCAAMAVWSKQTFILVIPAMAILGHIRGGWRGHGLVLAVCGGWFLLILGLLCLGYGARTLWYNLVTIPGSHAWIANFTDPPWHGSYTRPGAGWIQPGESEGRLLILLDSARNLVETCGLLLVGAVACVVLPFAKVRSRREFSREAVHHVPLGAFVFAVCLAPASILGPVKVGGAANTIAPAPWFALMAILASLAVWSVRHDIVGRNARLAMAGLALWGVLHLVPFPEEAEYVSDRLAGIGVNIHQLGFDYARQNPGKAWFSWCPLPELMATGELHHSTTGISERWFADDKLTAEQVRAWIPPDFEVIATNSDDWMLELYFPEYELLPDGRPPYAYQVLARPPEPETEPLLTGPGLGQ